MSLTVEKPLLSSQSSSVIHTLTHTPRQMMVYEVYLTRCVILGKKQPL